MIAPEPAAAHEALGLLELREQAARWMQDRGIRQWTPGEVSLDEVRQQINDREWFVLRRASKIVAGLRLLPTDEPVWGPQRADSTYVHGLIVHRRHAGEGLGAALLKWAEHQARRAGLVYLRLDCVESNSALRRYYARAGFQEVGRRDFDGPWHSAVLLEKRLT